MLDFHRMLFKITRRLAIGLWKRRVKLTRLGAHLVLQEVVAGPAESHPAKGDGQPVWSAWQIGKMIGYRFVVVSNVYMV